MLSGKRLLFGICGGIAAYKVVGLISALKKQGAQIQVVMTRAATQLVTPNTFRAITHNPVITELFAPASEPVQHIALADAYDLMVVAPATANVIGKAAAGIADDALTTTLISFYRKVLFVPAMNTNMWQHPAVQGNIATLRGYGYEVLEPASGSLACGTSGAGRLPDETVLLEAIHRQFAPQDLAGRKVLITSGGTREYLDAVRFLTNASSGKMGGALVAECLSRGAQVVHITSVPQTTAMHGLTTIEVQTAEQMLAAVSKEFADANIFISAAAVADFRPEQTAAHKLKKQDLGPEGFTLKLVPNPDILKTMAAKKQPGQFVVGFSLESQNLLQNSLKKMTEKNLDMIVANAPQAIGAEVSEITILTSNGERSLFTARKSELAGRIVDHIVARL